MVNTLEKRAYEWAKQQMISSYPENGSQEEKDNWNMHFNAYMKTYIDIAKEQQEVDIDKTCEWLEQQVYDDVIIDCSTNSANKSDLIKIFKQFMKN